MKRWRLLATVTAILILLAGLGLAFAPILYAEMEFMGLRPVWPLPPISAARVAGQSAGTVVDGYWRVQQIAPDTYAIGEPQNDPDNYEYLLLGQTRALLIDSGATARDIHPVLGDVRRAVHNIRTGQAKGQGLIIRRFPVNTRMTIVTFYPWGNR